MSHVAARDWARDLKARLALPLIVAPMYRVTGPELVAAACRNGVIGVLPTNNVRSVEELDSWFGSIRGALADVGDAAPYGVTLSMRHPRMKSDLDCILRHRPALAITSVGSPEPVVRPLHDIGCQVFADVASMRHVEKSIGAGVDGLILLTAGAGGETGWLNGFAFVRAVRSIFDGPIILAGGVGDGWALWAAETLGCDLAYMGTRFIATEESRASLRYKQMVVVSGPDDVILSTAFTGHGTSWLRPSIVEAGLDPKSLPKEVPAQDADGRFGFKATESDPRRWVDILSAGHSVAGARRIQSVADLVSTIADEYRDAKRACSVALRINSAAVGVP